MAVTIVRSSGHARHAISILKSPYWPSKRPGTNRVHQSDFLAKVSDTLHTEGQYAPKWPQNWRSLCSYEPRGAKNVLQHSVRVEAPQASAGRDSAWRGRCESQNRETFIQGDVRAFSVMSLLLDLFTSESIMCLSSPLVIQVPSSECPCFLGRLPPSSSALILPTPKECDKGPVDHSLDYQPIFFSIVKTWGTAHTNGRHCVSQARRPWEGLKEQLLRGANKLTMDVSGGRIGREK